MRLGVVSDTHGHLAFTREAVHMLEALDVDHVLHCGDIGSPEIVELFAAWPTDFVFGNVDYDVRALEDAIASVGGTCHGRFGNLTLGGIELALLHGNDVRRLGETIRSDRWKVVCHGHTHVATIQREQGTLVLNPGAVYRADPRSIAIIPLGSLEPEIVPI